MSVLRDNPLDIRVVGQRLMPAVDDQLKDLYEQLEEANNARNDWAGKQEKLIKQRRGIRNPKVFPWPGAANYSWPLIDGVIRKWKPGIVALVTQADPVCYFFPQKPEAVAAQPVAQAYFHFRFMSIPGVQKTALELADYVGQHGLGYTEQGWEYKTERSCRIVRVDTLFPDGVEQALEQFNAAMRQAQAEAQVAIQQGQASPDVLNQIQELSAPEFVKQVLEDEYLIRSDNPMEFDQVVAATEAILNGVQVVKFYYRIVVADRPSWKPLNPIDVIVPPRHPSSDLGNAPFIGTIHRLSADDVLKMAIDGHFDAEAAEVVAGKLQSRVMNDPGRAHGPGTMVDSKRDAITSVLDRADGVAQGFVNEPTVDVFWKVYAKIDINDDKLLEKVVIWYHPGSKTVLALYHYPYPFSEWPIVRFEFEHTNDRPFGARGIAEHLSVHQAMQNKLHNSRLDSISIVLAPMMQMRATAADLPRNIKFMPGAIIPVQTVGDIQPIPMDVNPLIQSLQEENYTKNLAEQHIGIFDPSVLSQNSVERRTATEVDAVTAQGQSVFGQDASLFQESMAMVFRQLWHLEIEFGPKDLVFRVTGETLPKLAKKHEIAFDYDLVPAGTPANTSKQLARARALESIQLFGPDMTGLINKHELYKYYFDVVDRNLSKLILRDPSQAAIIQEVLQLSANLNGGQPSAPPP